MPEAEALGHLAPAQLALIKRRGWFQLLAPRSLGGMELALPQAVRLEEAIAGADGNCGWVVTLCAGAGCFAGFLPPALTRAAVAMPGYAWPAAARPPALQSVRLKAGASMTSGDMPPARRTPLI